MHYTQKNINEFDVYDKLLNNALNLLNENKIDECKALLENMKIFSKHQSKMKCLNESMFIDNED